MKVAHGSKHMEQQVRDMVQVLWSFRRANGLTQTQVAKKLGVTYNHISMVERGHRIPSVYFLQKWAQLYGMNLYIKIGA